MTRATTLRAAAVVVSGFLIATLMAMGVSRALFTNPTSNDANAFTSGNVVLVNQAATSDGGSPFFDETGSALFSFTAMVVDFTSGLTYALNGRMAKTAQGVILVSPAGVTVGVDELDRLAAAGLYSPG